MQQACEFRCFSSCVIVARAFSIPFYLPNALPPGISNMQLEGPGFQHKCSPFYPPNHGTHSGAPLSNVNLKASLFLFSLTIYSLCPQTSFHTYFLPIIIGKMKQLVNSPLGNPQPPAPLPHARFSARQPSVYTPSGLALRCVSVSRPHPSKSALKECPNMKTSGSWHTLSPLESLLEILVGAVRVGQVNE